LNIERKKRINWLLIIIGISIFLSCGKKSQDTEPPLPPVIISAVVEGSKVNITLNPSPSDDVVLNRIYRTTNDVEEKIGEIPDLTFVDESVVIGEKYIYFATAVDDAGNESVPSNMVEVSIGESNLCGNGICDPGENQLGCPDDCNVQTLEICNSNGDAIRIVSSQPADGSTIPSGKVNLDLTVEYKLSSVNFSNMALYVFDESSNLIDNSLSKSISFGCGAEAFNVEIEIPTNAKIIYAIVYFTSVDNTPSDRLNFIVDPSSDWVNITSSVPADGSMLNQGTINMSISLDYNLYSAPNATLLILGQDETGNIITSTSSIVVQGRGTLTFDNIIIETTCLKVVQVKTSLLLNNQLIVEDSISFPVRISNEKMIKVDPPEFTFSALVGGQNPSNQTLKIRRCGGNGEVSWELTDDAMWLTPSLNTGQTPSDVFISVDISGLTEGIYNATMTLTSGEAVNTPIVINVQLNVMNINLQWVTPPPEPMNSNETYQVEYSVSGGTTGNWWIQYGRDPDPINNPEEYTQIQSGSMGTYTDNLTLFTCTTTTYYFVVAGNINGFHVYSNIISRTLQPSIQKFLVVFPSSFVFSAPEGGSNPNPKLLTVSEICNNSIYWVGMVNVPWLTISPASGTTTTSVGVLVNINGLLAGSYQGNIILSSQQSANSPILVPVTLNICQDDPLEQDDNNITSTPLTVNGASISHLLIDPDYHSFNALNGVQYVIETFNLSSETDTTLTLYDTDGVTILRFDDDSGGGLASKITWVAPADGTYYVKVASAFDNYVCGSSYEIKITSQ